MGTSAPGRLTVFKQPLDDDAIAPLVLQLPVAPIDADDAEPAALMESNACGVLGKDTGHDLPEPALGARVNESLQSRTPRTGAARITCDIHRVLGDSGIRRPVPI